ncbi:MAG: flavodoxin family protein [Deltaproteobacteria bacterium]|nr:flavodoxin family protein [Deltaproteobacteria bacterium]
MGKALVIFHSQHNGDTKEMAEAVAEGLREGGAGLEIINTNERRITLNEFKNADGIALGSPDYYSYVAGTIKTFFDDLWLWDRAGEDVKGKPAVFFFSHGKGGRGKEPFETFGNRYFEQVGETVDSTRPTSEEIKKECRAVGKALAEKIG